MNKRDLIVDYLTKLFPDANCELEGETPFEFLVSVILSAQCTDKRVNMTTPALFAKYNTPKDFVGAEIQDVENIIRPCGFYHNKAKNIILLSHALLDRFDGIVPNTLEELMSLPGVGMKTAKVVLGFVFNRNVMAVDTHVLRVSNRLGIVSEKNPDKCSILLEKYFKNDVQKLHHRLVLFGRYYCKALSPKCDVCELKGICKYYNEVKNVSRQSKNNHKSR